jgi:hypothetical protein
MRPVRSPLKAPRVWARMARLAAVLLLAAVQSAHAATAIPATSLPCPRIDPPTWLEPSGVKVRYRAFDVEPTFFAKRGEPSLACCTRNQPARRMLYATWWAVRLVDTPRAIRPGAVHCGRRLARQQV